MQLGYMNIMHDEVYNFEMQYLVVEEDLDICREDYLMFASAKSAKQSVQYQINGFLSVS